MIHGKEEKRLSAIGIRNFLAKDCYISFRSETFQWFLLKDFSRLMTVDQKLSLKESKKRLKDAEKVYKTEIFDCDRDF